MKTSDTNRSVAGRSEREFELWKCTLPMYVDLYKHHHEMVVKAAIVYLAVVGFAAGFVLRSDVTVPLRIALAILVAIASVAAFWLSLQTTRNFHDTERLICDAGVAIGIRIPGGLLKQSRTSILAIQAGSVLFFVIALATAVLVLSRP